jgi:DNA-binding MarR family transcriptional regulator
VNQKPVITVIGAASTTFGPKGMGKAGFVVRGSDDSDERISRVFLTDAGRAIRPAVEKVWTRLDRQLFAGFSERELSLLADFLVRVCRNIERNT